LDGIQIEAQANRTKIKSKKKTWSSRPFKYPSKQAAPLLEQSRILYQRLHYHLLNPLLQKRKTREKYIQDDVSIRSQDCEPLPLGFFPGGD